MITFVMTKIMCYSQVGVTLFLLYQQLGLAFLAGVAFAVILIPINRCIAQKIGQLSTEMMRYKDERVKASIRIFLCSFFFFLVTVCSLTVYITE